MTINAFIFDLDNCLAPAREIGEELFDPVFTAVRQANCGGLTEDALERAFADMWRHPMDLVAEEHGFSEAMRAAAWRASTMLETSRPMSGYGDLEILATLPGLRFLVTSGFRRLQESKIAALGLAPFFTALHIDAIDQTERPGKKGLFRRILDEYGLAPAEVLVIGDSAHSEIAAGNELGIHTVQTLRPGVPRAENADFHIHSLAEIDGLLAAWADG